eukprot:4570165-Amphidinium_carterae.2
MKTQTEKRKTSRLAVESGVTLSKQCMHGTHSEIRTLRKSLDAVNLLSISLCDILSGPQCEGVFLVVYRQLSAE